MTKKDTTTKKEVQKADLEPQKAEPKHPEWVVEAAKNIIKNQQRPFKIKAVEGENPSSFASLSASPEEDSCRLYETTGFTDFDGQKILIDQIIKTQPNSELALNINAAFAMVNGIKPQDPLEGLLAVQMVACHNMAMEYAKRAMNKNNTDPDLNDRYINRTAKLMRTFANQVETLNRYRNQGKQTIQVQHVQVNDGGQAIVGNVNQGRG